MVAVAYVYIHYCLDLENKKKKSRRWWQTQLYATGNVRSGATLLSDLTSQTISGEYKKFTRISRIKTQMRLCLRFVRRVTNLDTRRPPNSFKR